jgi:hypothetical protein
MGQNEEFNDIAFLGWQRIDMDQISLPSDEATLVSRARQSSSLVMTQVAITFG